jgi:hypothetical protein
MKKDFEVALYVIFNQNGRIHKLFWTELIHTKLYENHAIAKMLYSIINTSRVLYEVKSDRLRITHKTIDDISAVKILKHKIDRTAFDGIGGARR